MQPGIPTRVDRSIRFAGVGLALIVAFLAYRGWVAFERIKGEVNQCRSVLQAVNDLRVAVKDAESSQRGYLLGGGAEFVESYRAAIASIPSRLQTLQSTVDADRKQRVRAAELKKLIDLKLSELGATIALVAGENRTAAIDRFRTGEGVALMTAIRRQVTEMSDYEYEHLAEGAASTERVVFVSFLISASGLVGIIVILVALDRAVDKAVARRDELAARLESARLQLETTLRSIGDGVITIGTDGRVTFLNATAEDLTGWSDSEAAGRPVEKIFCIVDEINHEPTGNSIGGVLQASQFQSLAKHTLLVDKTGTELAIDGSVAPIRDEAGKLLGGVIVFHDVSQRRKAEIELEYWYQLFLQAGFGIAVIGADNVIADANHGFAAMHGYTVEEVRGMNLSTLIADGDTAELDFLLGDNPLILESTHRRKDGSHFAVLTDVTTLPTVSGKGVRVAYVSDITARKEAQRRENLINERFRGAAEAVGDIIWTNNGKGEMEGPQIPWGRYTGQSQEEYQGYGWSNAIHPDDVQPTIDAWKQAVQDQRKFVFEHRVRSHDGEYRIFAVRALPIFEDSGIIREWVGVHADITDERRLEETVRDSEERFRGLAAALPQMVWSSGPDGDIQYANSLWDEYAGERVSDVARGPWTSILHPQDAETYVSQWNRSLVSGENFVCHCRLKRASDGTYRWFLCRSVPVRGRDGNIMRWLGVCTDIDDQMRDADNLKRANDALRATNADLEQFAYAASHDLQEPLRMVSLYTQLLREDYGGKIDDTGRSYIDLAVTGAQRMERLLQDLLSYSRVAAEPPSGETHVSDANEALHSALENLQNLIQSTQASIRAAMLPRVCMPAVHLVQLFQNLVGNALKYHSDQTPTVIIATEKKHDMIEFSIRDNGIGIDKQYLGQIFGVFKRLHGREYEGTGIGLALCQRIVERNGGRIWVESDASGSTFFFTVPAAPDRIDTRP